jgi:hypothetical protein
VLLVSAIKRCQPWPLTVKYPRGIRWRRSFRLYSCRRWKWLALPGGFGWVQAR